MTNVPLTPATRFGRFRAPLTGLVLGLYVARVLLEVLPYPIPVATIVVTLASSAVLSLGLTTVAYKGGLDLSPLLVLLVYVLWPWMYPLLALGCAFVAGLALARTRVHKSYPAVSDMLLFLTAISLYVHTLAPTILPADSGEFQFVSYILGIAHPPGYPLYTLLAKICTLLPVGDIAYRVNLFAALTSASALLLLSRAVRRATGSTLAGWVAAAVLGLTPTFWAQSTTANIRSLTALFTAAQIGALIAYAQSKDDRWLTLFALAFGLGVTHHGSTAFHALAYAAFLIVYDPGLLRRPRAWIRPFVAFLASFLVWLYLPLRSVMGTPFDSPSVRTLPGFLDHVLARGFRGDMFYFLQPGILGARLGVLWNILTFEFSPVLLVVAGCGAAFMLLRERRLLLLCVGLWAINAFTAIAYRAPQTVEYMMPAHVALAFVCAYGAWSVSKLRNSRICSSLVLATALAVPLWMGIRNYPSFAQLSQDRSARQYAENLLTQAPPNTRILTNWHWVTPLWYLQYVEKVRPDVEVVYVYPEGDTPNSQVWLRRISESAAQHPTIVTSFFQEFETASYQFQPFGDAWLVQTGPSYELPAGIQTLDTLFDGRIHFAGFDLQGTVLAPADSLRVRLYWQPAIKLDRDYSFFVHLVDESGVPIGQGDVTHQAARYETGQVLVDEYRIPLLPTVRAGRYRLIGGVYITPPEGGWRRLTTPEGKDSVTLGQVEIQPLPSAPVTRHEMNRPFAQGYCLVGVDYDRSVADQLRVYLHWRCERPEMEQDLFLFVESPSATGDTPAATARLPLTEAGTYFSTAHDLPADARAIRLELHTASSGVPSRLLGPARLPVGQAVRLPTPGPLDRYLDLGGEMVLLRAEPPSVVADGKTLRTGVTLVGLKPITSDYTVSLSLVGGEWQTQHDGTPALGAIPTLKWIRGSTVRDPHNLPLPPEANGAATLRLTVYDAFTMRPLPVLDERLARVGQGTHVEIGVVQVP